MMEYNIDIQVKGKQKVNVALSRVTTLVQNVYPSGIVYSRPPLLRETISYAAYDYADLLQRGAFDYTPPAYPEYYQELDLAAANPFTTLKHPNIHGTLDRFTDTQGGQIYSDGWIQDHYAGLEWCIGYFNEQTVYTNWNDVFANSPTINYNGRIGRLPSNIELISISNLTLSPIDSFNYSPFYITDTGLKAFISVNTNPNFTDKFNSVGGPASAFPGSFLNQGKTINEMKTLYVRRIDQPLNTY